MTIVCKISGKEREVCEACGNPALPSRSQWQGEGKMFYCTHCAYTFKKGLGGRREEVCKECARVPLSPDQSAA